MAECRYPLCETEVELGTWTTDFIIPDNGCYRVNLTITNINLIFLGVFDLCLNSLIDLASFETYGNDQFLIITRKNIILVTPRKSVLNKQITIMTCDNNEYIIDHGMLPIDPILEALGK